MRKRGIIFLESLVVSLTFILIFTTMVHCTYPSVFGISSSEKICFKHRAESWEFNGLISQNLKNIKAVDITLKFGSIRNIIGTDGEILPWFSRISSANIKSISAQIFFEYLPRASPLPKLVN